MTYETQLGYSTNCWKQLEEILPQTPDLIHREYVTTSPFKSIFDVLLHIVGAEARWEARLRLGTHDPKMQSFEKDFKGDLPELFAVQKKVRGMTVHQLSVINLDDVVPVVLANWNVELNMTKGEIVWHITNHERFHLGQVVMALQMFGEDPPNFDLPFLHP